MHQYAGIFGALAVFITGLTLRCGAADAWAGADFLRTRNSNPFFSNNNNNNAPGYGSFAAGGNRPFPRTFLGYFPDASHQQQLASRQVIYGDGDRYAFNRQPSLWRYAEPTKRIPFEDFARSRLALQQQQQQRQSSLRLSPGEPWDIFSHVVTDPALGFSPAEGQRCTADKQCGSDMECIAGVIKSNTAPSSSSSIDALLLGAKKKREDEKTCQPAGRDRSKLQFNDDCNSSDECDMARGLCCQSVRLVRQAPRQACLYAMPRHADELCLFRVE